MLKPVIASSLIVVVVIDRCVVVNQSLQALKMYAVVVVLSILTMIYALCF